VSQQQKSISEIETSILIALIAIFSSARHRNRVGGELFSAFSVSLGCVYSMEKLLQFILEIQLNNVKQFTMDIARTFSDFVQTFGYRIEFLIQLTKFVSVLDGE
jgi:hypothetical protein